MSDFVLRFTSDINPGFVEKGVYFEVKAGEILSNYCASHGSIIARFDPSMQQYQKRKCFLKHNIWVIRSAKL